MGKLLSRFKYLYNLKIINSHSICFKKKKDWVIYSNAERVNKIKFDKINSTH